VKSIIIRINNYEVSFSDQEHIPLKCSNIPFELLRFSDTRDIYWEVEMISFTKDEGRLIVRVIDYQSKRYERFSLQTPKYPIKFVEFEPFEWKQLQEVLSVYQKKKLKPFLLDASVPLEESHVSKLSFRVPLAKITFGMGFITFQRDFKWRRPLTEIKITHLESLPQYEYVKFYFARILGKKTIDVDMVIESTSTEHKITSIRSTDLKKITRDSVGILKIRKLDEWVSRKPKFAPPDQQLFTFEEAMASYGDQAFGNIDIFERDMLFHILEKEGVRNRMQLRYLSEVIHEKGERLLMTLVPQFGFVFIFRGEEMTHYIWELMNSHATYIWSIPISSTSDCIKVIENELRIISSKGRQIYKAGFQAKSNLFFKTLRHRSSKYSYEEYFARWKKEVDNLMI